jgi:hypothetical protein
VIPSLSEHKKTCFEATLEAASEFGDVTVVHAWLPTESGWAVHAWAETEEAVLDLTVTRTPLDRSEYYEARRVSEVLTRRYPRVEFFTLVGDTGTFGPFDKDLFFALESAKNPARN